MPGGRVGDGDGGGGGGGRVGISPFKKVPTFCRPGTVPHIFGQICHL